MKVILLRDIAKIGRKHDVVNLPDGYAQNKLIPNKDAEPATPGNIKRIQKLQAKNKVNQADREEEIKNLAAKFKDNPLPIPMEINEVGHLFKGVSATEIVAAAKEQGVTVSESYLKISEPIKSAGEHEVDLVAGDAHYKLPITVVNNK